MIKHVTDRDRTLAFLRSLDRRASTRVEHFRFGTAYFNERLPVVWDRNFIAVEEALGETACEPLEADVERLQGGAGLEHRKLVFDAEPAGRAIGPLLAAAGWELRRVTVMVHRGSIADAGSDNAREVAPEEPRSGRAEMLRAEGERFGADAVRQVLEADDVVSALVSERCFASVEEATPVAWCRLAAGLVLATGFRRGRGPARGAAGAGLAWRLGLALEDDRVALVTMLLQSPIFRYIAGAAATRPEAGMRVGRGARSRAAAPPWSGFRGASAPSGRWVPACARMRVDCRTARRAEAAAKENASRSRHSQ